MGNQDQTSQAGERTQIEIGMRVQAGEGEDRDTGRVDEIDADKGMAIVSWDSLVVTPCPISDLLPE